MAVAIVQTSGPTPVVVRLQADSAADTTVPTSETTVAGVAEPKDPSPLKIVPAELYWAGGCFIILLILMRLVLYPRVAKGMDERTGYIKANHEEADRAREAANVERQQYEAQLATARAEANRRLDAARDQIEQERQSALAETTATLSGRRQEALAEVAAARAAASGRLADVTADVVAHASMLILGRIPDPEVVRRAVTASMNGGAS
jgi:F-type H+-transporting ATPase subunit b